MTEDEWLSSPNLTRLLGFVQDSGVSERKLRLFACACARRVWPSMKARASRRAVEVCEAYADGLSTEAKLVASCNDANEAFATAQWSADGDEKTTPARVAIRLGRESEFSPSWTADWASSAAGVRARDREFKRRSKGTHPEQAEPWEQYNATYKAEQVREEGVQATLIRDIVGNPFRPTIFASDWRTSTVVSLAQQMYDTRDFGPMPVLADALQDAGREDENVLSHCRGPGPHVWGCWVVDLVLGKE